MRRTGAFAAFLAAVLLTGGTPASAAPSPSSKGGRAASGRAGPAPIRYRYAIQSARSRVTFTFRGLVLPFDAHFTVLEGEIFLGAGHPLRRARGWLRVAARSVRAGEPAQEAMLRGDVLEARRFPDIRLEVDRVKPLAPAERRGRERRWRLGGEGLLRLHGVERRVALEFRLEDTGADLYLRGRGRLRLSDFGMARPKVLVLVPGQDVVEVRVRLVASPAPR